MRTSLSRKDLRAERLNQSPYARPARGEIRRSASHSAFSPLSSLVNFVSAPFRKNTLPRHSQDADGRILADDQRSVSGSEDGWNGEPPAIMEEVDVFSLASAAGRGGPEFEARAQTWRANKGLLAQSSRGIRNSNSSWELLSLDVDRSIRPSPSMPAFRESIRKAPSAKSSVASSRPAAPGAYINNKHLSTPKAGAASSSYTSSPSSVALRSFLDAKGDAPMNVQDIDVLESLTRSMRAETRQTAQPVGGWSAGTFAATPVRNTDSPRSTATPESSFSIGAATPSRFTPASSKRQVTYLGPGMSARRLNKPRQTLTPLFSLDDGPKDDAPGKKRKVDLDADDDKASERSAGDDAAASAAAQFNAKVKSRFAAPSKPSPLGQPSPQKALSDDIVKAGKKRAADILQEVFDAEVGPIESTKPTIVFNPYEEASVVPTGKFEASRSSLRKSASALRASLRSSSVAKRGAAEKIERLGSGQPGRKLSTLELVSGFKPAASASRRSESPEEEDEDADEIDVDEAPEQPSLKLPEPVRAPAPVAAKPVKVPEADTYQPFNVPSLSSSTLGNSTSPALKAPETLHSAVADSVIAASKPAPAPVFKPTPIGLGPPPAAEPSSAGPSTTARSTSRRVDPSAIYLSAKDSALNVDKAALPFFTFNLPSGSSSPEPSEAVKAAVRKDHSEQPFLFTLSKTSIPSASIFSPPAPQSLSLPKPAAAGSQWTCDTCMLQNPDSAKEQCTICEAPRPGVKAAAPPKAALPAPPAPPATGGFAFGGSKPAAPAAGGFTIKAPATKAGDWTCDTCMLQNPDSAKEKCTVCEAPRPGAAPAVPAAAAPPAPPAVPAAFTTKAPAAAPGQWECTTCMLKNPDSAKEKCTVCEAPRPGAPAPAAEAPKPPAFGLPAPPTGGFSFGGKPPAPPSGGFAFGGSAKPAAPAAPASGFGGFKPTVAAPATGFSFGGSSSSSSGGAFGGFTPSVAAPSGGFGGFGSFGKPSTPAAKPAAAATGKQWTCDTCMLQNPDSAKEQCTICEAPRPAGK
ncbi:Nuclear pore complex protein [Vanrija pseudolonga]|uniref:Nuclear pore complex protein n=1 Tax=Vanrija pseudolonga TaxID=143232 RepID=A0AAF0YD85_9TREE|nr:Nuclear pore complex protein [Vanrija pseudolonga]